MESQYYRTFIAVPPGVGPVFLQAREELIAALKEERISWTNPDNYHVTIRFIGDTKIADIKKIGKTLRAGIHIPQRFSLDISGLASFGPRKKPRVIWVGFEEANFFDLLKKDVDRVLELCGIPAGEKPYRAHLTLGRIRRLQNLQNYYGTVGDMALEFNSTVRFEKLVFFRSILGPRGPEYHVLDEIRFLE